MTIEIRSGRKRRRRKELHLLCSLELGIVFNKSPGKTKPTLLGMPGFYIFRNMKHPLKTIFWKSGIKQFPNFRQRVPYLRLGTVATFVGFITYDYLAHDFTYTCAAGRFMRSLKVATLIAYDYWLLESKGGSENYEELVKAVHMRSAKRLLDSCLLNGGLYIKVGQGVAAINHILPLEYTQTLSKLQDECLPTKRQNVQRVFKEEFGSLPEDIYQQFDYKPIAAASLAQVFRAKLKTGEDVAVKVQYDDLQKRFPSDLGTIMFLQNIIEFFFRNYNFGWILKDLRSNLVSEMDFIKEAKNSEQCAESLKRFNYVYIPKVYWEYTKQRILTLEWIDGIKVTDMADIEKRKLNLREIDFKLFTVFAEQIFRTGFVHADPHPGNIFVRKDREGHQVQLVVLDHGLYENVPEKVRNTLCEFWEATVLKDEHRMRTSAEKLHIKEYKNFAQVLFQVPFKINGGRIKTKLSDEDITYMQQEAKHNFDSVMGTLKEMPRNMLFVVRNLNTIRAIGRTHGDVVDRPKIMARHAQRCLYVKSNSILSYLRWICRRIVFEYHLLMTSFKMSAISFYLNTLHKLGRSPIETTNIFRMGD